MTFDEDEVWKKDVIKFDHLIGQITFYDEPLFAEDKVSKLLRTLPPHFVSTAMVVQALNVPFKMIIAPDKAETSRRKKKDTEKPPLHVAVYEGVIYES